jgi:hypothetical protein
MAAMCAACPCPATRSTFGVPGTITPLVDLWIRERRLPDYMRAVKLDGA